MIDVRCKGCNKLLAKTLLMVAAIKCPKCYRIFEYRIYTNLHMSNAYDIVPSEPQDGQVAKSNATSENKR